MMTLISRWFEQSNASQDYRLSDYILLGLVLLAGLIVRFWGLGNVGLHGDEETMAMPAMAIIDTGEPVLPSGMYYGRALLQIYLMAASVLAFGESEWAFRLPSAVVGSLTGLVAFFMGRRFLDREINLAFVATITFLPAMIEYSQTARMYVFFVTCIIWFGACLFKWERDQRITSLILALLVWTLSLHFQRLAILSAPLFLFPGLSRQSRSLLIQGAAAFVVAVFVFDAYNAWIGALYPSYIERPPDNGVSTALTSLEVLMSSGSWLAVASVTAIVSTGILLLWKSVRLSGWRQIAPVLLLCSGLLAMVGLHYHAGGILLLLGIVFWFRAPGLPKSWLLLPIMVGAAIATVHLGILYDSGLYPGRKLIGAVVGVPSVWPTLRFLEYSPFAGVAYTAVLVFALKRFAMCRPLPMHILFFMMSVWAALLIIGYYSWYTPLRYAAGQIGFFLMCVFAGLAFLARELRWISNASRIGLREVSVIVLLSAALINPPDLVRVVNPDYDRYPDHKGAAEYILSLDARAGTILIAEDVLQQTYYLGRVDYSLRPIDDARSFSFLQDGLVVDQYTGVPVIGTGEELLSFLKAHAGENVYIIGSGENFVGGKRLLRGHGIGDVLGSEQLKTVYEGRDGRTKVWKSNL